MGGMSTTATAAIATLLFLSPLHLIAEKEAKKGTYKVLKNSKEICREGHAKSLNNIAKYEVISDRIIKIFSFQKTV